MLHKQIGHLEEVSLTTLKAKWRGVCLPLKTLEGILQKVGTKDGATSVEWRGFLVETAIFLTPEGGDVASTMQILIEVNAERSEGIAVNLSDEDFLDFLRRVCERRGVPYEEAQDHLMAVGKKQGGVLTFENLKSHDCPKMD